MTQLLTDALQEAPIIPLVTPDDMKTAIDTAEALLEGGLKVIEVVLRTDDAVANLEKMVSARPDALIGAGTVLSVGQARKVIDLGAKFIVCPGLDEDIVRLAQKDDLPVYPGIATATELQRAWNLGLKAVKFFPAGSSGGPGMIKDLSGPFRDMKFIPTGGISAANLHEYLSLPTVMACGGSWLTPKAAIAEGDYAAIKKLALDALEVARQI